MIPPPVLHAQSMTTAPRSECNGTPRDNWCDGVSSTPPTSFVASSASARLTARLHSSRGKDDRSGVTWPQVVIGAARIRCRWTGRPGPDDCDRRQRNGCSRTVRRCQPTFGDEFGVRPAPVFRATPKSAARVRLDGSPAPGINRPTGSRRGRRPSHCRALCRGAALGVDPTRPPHPNGRYLNPD